MAKEDNNIHAGHRERLLETVYKVGLYGLSDVQVMEFILFYVFPRGDVNPLAHRLLDKFKNISTVLDASLNDLAVVKGMGQTSAKKLKSIVEIFNIYTSSKANKDDGLSNFGDIYGYAESLLRHKNTEELYVFGFNSSGEFVADRCLARGTLKMVGIDMREISNFVNTYNVPIVYVAHNHPDNSCKPSKQDIVSAEELKRKFEFSGCELRDNFIVGNDGIFSIYEKGLKRVFGKNDKFDDILELINKDYESFASKKRY